jgi:hypothetical protein
VGEDSRSWSAECLAERTSRVGSITYVDSETPLCGRCRLTGGMVVEFVQIGEVRIAKSYSVVSKARQVNSPFDIAVLAHTSPTSSSSVVCLYYLRH